jgi:PAS domain S-box-containing protein
MGVLMTRRDELDIAQHTISFFETILKSTSDGILIVDNNNQIIETNDAFCVIINSQKAQVKETNIYDWLSQLGQEAVEQWNNIVHALDTNKRSSNFHFDIIIMGKPRNYTVNASLIDKIKEKETRIIVTIWRDITEREKARRIEDLFCHDIQNKNMIIESYLILLQRRNLQEKEKEFVNSAIKSVKMSTALLKKVSQLRAVRYNEKVLPIKLHLVIQAVIDEHTYDANKNGIDIEYASSVSIIKGGNLLNELISIIIDNAIKHSQCSKIKIWNQENHTALIVIEDNGVGIPEFLHDNLFLKGTKGEKSNGEGLGLYLVSQIVESYSGTIHVRKSEMGGARFEIRLEIA